MNHLNYDDARTLGVILEVNRQLLHPRGLALEISIPNAENSVAVIAISNEHIEAFENLLTWLVDNIQEKSTGEENGDQWRAWVEVVQEMLADATRTDGCVLRLQDHRDDNEGVYFDDLDEADLAKAEAFQKLAHRLEESRSEALGYTVQPLRVAEPN